jgi:hypothetical protein
MAREVEAMGFSGGKGAIFRLAAIAMPKSTCGGYVSLADLCQNSFELEAAKPALWTLDSKIARPVAEVVRAGRLGHGWVARTDPGAALSVLFAYSEMRCAMLWSIPSFTGYVCR